MALYNIFSAVSQVTCMLGLLTVGPKFTRLACSAVAAASGRYLLPAPDRNSKPACRRCCCRSTGQTDGRTDWRPAVREVHGILCGPRNDRGILKHGVCLYRVQSLRQGELFVKSRQFCLNTWIRGGSVAEWLACWTRAQKGPGSNRSRDAVGQQS